MAPAQSNLTRTGRAQGKSSHDRLGRRLGTTQRTGKRSCSSSRRPGSRSVSICDLETKAGWALQRRP
eukprot:6204027-Pleurochrysis_carterae.AAC.4